MFFFLGSQKQSPALEGHDRQTGHEFCLVEGLPEKATAAGSADLEEVRLSATACRGRTPLCPADGAAVGHHLEGRTTPVDPCRYGIAGLGRGRQAVQPVGPDVRNRPGRVRAAGGRPERYLRQRHRERHRAGLEPDVLHIRVGVPVHVLGAGNRGRLRGGHHVDDRGGGRQHAGHYRHRDGEGAEERAELVHRQPGRGRLFLGHHRHTVLVGQRADGLLDIRRLVVRHTRRPGRAAVHRVHNEPVPDRARPVLVHHAGRRLPEEAHARPGHRHDRVRVDI